jgi:hypothetical protein
MAEKDKYGFLIPYSAHNPKEWDMADGDLDITTTGNPFIFKANTDDGDYTVITYQAYYENHKTLDDSIAVHLYSCVEGEWQMTPLAKLYASGTESEIINYSIL